MLSMHFHLVSRIWWQGICFETCPSGWLQRELTANERSESEYIFETVWGNAVTISCRWSRVRSLGQMRLWKFGICHHDIDGKFHMIVYGCKIDGTINPLGLEYGEFRKSSEYFRRMPWFSTWNQILLSEQIVNCWRLDADYDWEKAYLIKAEYCVTQDNEHVSNVVEEDPWS